MFVNSLKLDDIIHGHHEGFFEFSIYFFIFHKSKKDDPREGGGSCVEREKPLHIMCRICLHAPQKDELMWRILTYAAQKCVMLLSDLDPHTEFNGSYASVRRRSPSFCGTCWHMHHRS
jgi:hypothetical protein